MRRALENARRHRAADAPLSQFDRMAEFRRNERDAGARGRF